jgi:hypothetical protein
MTCAHDALHDALIYGVLRSGQPFDVDFEKKKPCVS